MVIKFCDKQTTTCYCANIDRRGNQHYTSHCDDAWSWDGIAHQVGTTNNTALLEIVVTPTDDENDDIDGSEGDEVDVMTTQVKNTYQSAIHPFTHPGDDHCVDMCEAWQ